MRVLLQTFVFSVSGKNWMRYDWKKITTIGVTYTNVSLVCYAHSRGVKVVKLGTLIFIPLLTFYSLIRHAMQ